MKQLTDSDDLKGKTIAQCVALVTDPEAVHVLIFADETFVVLVAGEGDNCASGCLIKNEIKQEFAEYAHMNNLILKTVGIKSEAEYKDFYHRQYLQMKAQNKSREDEKQEMKDKFPTLTNLGVIN